MAFVGALSASIVATALAVLAGCGQDRPADSLGGDPDDTISPPEKFEVASVHPSLGTGEPAYLQGARLTEAGALQVVATGARCSAVSGVDVTEKAQSVIVVVRIAKLSDSPCPAVAVPWFVEIPLDSPLDNRSVMDGSTAASRVLRVEDCGSNDQESYCEIPPRTEQR